MSTSRNIPSATAPSFERFVEQVCSQAAIDELTQRCELERDVVERRVRVSAAEARQTLRVLSGLSVESDSRILEVGSGLGVASGYLASEGFDVTALEPSGTGFGVFDKLTGSFREVVNGQYRLLAEPAEQLSKATHGEFALCFSNNVLEHVRDFAVAVRAIAGVLSPVGVMVHSCPNYSIPYEPHFGIPLVPGASQFTERLLPRSIRTSDLWDSLNFVRARDVSAIATELGFCAHLRSGVLASSIGRLRSDEQFRSRHGFLGDVLSTASRFGLINAVRRLPPQWSTPMDFLLAKPDAISGEALARWTDAYLNDGAPVSANRVAAKGQSGR